MIDQDDQEDKEAKKNQERDKKSRRRQKSITGLRRHHIKNTSSDFKQIQRPCLVQTEALFDENRCLSLQE